MNSQLVSKLQRLDDSIEISFKLVSPENKEMTVVTNNYHITGDEESMYIWISVSNEYTDNWKESTVPWPKYSGKPSEDYMVKLRDTIEYGQITIVARDKKTGNVSTEVELDRCFLVSGSGNGTSWNSDTVLQKYLTNN